MKKRGIICYATEQGLGRQAKSFFDNGLIHEVFVQPHSVYENHYEWYPDRVNSFKELLEKVDEVWFLETPFDWNYILQAREKKVRTVLFIMYECTRFPLPYYPDALVGGSIMEKIHFGDTVKVINVPVPKELTWRLRQEALVFVHNAGHGGLGGRNGTKELIDAMRYVKSPIKLIIRTQSINFKSHDPRVEIRRGDFEYSTLFEEGDVFVYPDKFGGSCLPVQEACAAGMMVMASDRMPHNTWLSKDCLIPIKGYKKEIIGGAEFDSAIVDPQDIALTIDKFYNENIELYSLRGRKWGVENSWKHLKSEYEKI